MTKRAIVTTIPKVLADLGLSIEFDGDYHCIDTDGACLRSYPLKASAIQYLRECFASEIESQESVD